MGGHASTQLVIAAWALIGAYAVLALVLVYRGSRRTRSMQDYALGSLAFSPVFVGLSLAASMTSAATFVINPGLIALYGVSGVISLAVILPLASLGSLVVLTKGFRAHGTKVKAATLSQWIGRRFGSRGFALYFAFLSLLLLTFVVLICVGLTKVLAWALDLDQLWVLLGVVIFVFGCVTFGGANSMVYTNAIQAMLMVVVAFVLLGSGWEHFQEGVSGLLAKLAAIDPNLAQATNPASFLFRDWFEIGVCTTVVGAAIVCQPHIITKSLLLKSDREVNRYLLVAVVTEVLFFLVVIVGLYARLEFPTLTLAGKALGPDDVMSAYVVGEFPALVGVVVIMGLLAAGISTLEGLIQSLSTTLTTDILRPLFGRWYPKAEQPRARLELRLNRGVIALLAVAAVLLSWDQLMHPDLSVAIFAQNGVYAFFAAAFMPTLLGIYRRQTDRLAAQAASVTALAVHFGVYYGRLTPYMQLKTRNPGVAAALAILASVSVGLAVLAVVALGERGRGVAPGDSPAATSRRSVAESASSSKLRCIVASEP